MDRMRIAQGKETRWKWISEILLLLSLRRHFEFESCIVDIPNAHAQIPYLSRKMADESRDGYDDSQLDYKKLRDTHETVSLVVGAMAPVCFWCCGIGTEN